MPVVKLTLPFVRTAPIPKDRQIFYFDYSFPRFCLCVYPSGRKTFFVKYQNEYGKARWLKVGDFKTMTLEDAREAATEILRDVDKNKEDPAKDKRTKKRAQTVADLCDWYLEDGCSHKKQSTIEGDRGRIDTLIKPLIGNEPVASLTQGQVITFMRDIIKGDKVYKHEKSGKPRGTRRVRGGNGAAARTVQTLGAIMHFAIKQGLIQTNPVKDVDTPKAQPRKVFLTLDEIRQLGKILQLPIWATLHKSQCDLIRLILLTGCRKSEITTLKWEYVDFEKQIFHFPDTKTGQQDRPFGIGALNLLRQLESVKQSDWVFPSIRGNGHLENLLRLFKRMCETTDDKKQRILNKPGLNLHALRHTFASLAADMGYSDITIAALLGHRLGTVTSRYTHTVDKTLISAANDVSQAIENALNNE